MAESKACDKGDYFPFTQETRPNVVPLPEPETEATPLTSKPQRSLAPRVQRFSKLSDAYFNITSRQGSTNTVSKASDQSQSSTSTATSDLVASAPFPVASPRLVKSQDDLQISGSALAMPCSVKRTRRASFGSVDFFEDLSSNMGRNDRSLSKEIESELLSLQVKSQDTTGSTIEGILAQYDVGTSSLELEYGNTREYRVNADLSISQPPQGSLPESPPINFQSASSVRQTECDSPFPDSSITDSQHLLDVEAQVNELEEARRAFFPSPLNVGQTRHGIKILREPWDAVANNARAEIATNNPFVNQKDEDYKTYLRLPMERDISQQLSHVSRNIGHSTGKLYSSDGYEDFSARQGRHQGNTLGASNFLKVPAGERPIRHIKVVIGPELETGKDSQSRHSAQVDAKNGHHDVLSEDGDWVTEATSDAGFDLCTGTLPGRPLIGGFKRAGSSIADYSDEYNEDTMDRFGSHERIVQNPGGNKPYKSCDGQRLNESKFAALLPRRQNQFLENANRRWASAGRQEPGQFRPQILLKSTNPFREFGSRRPETPRRLVFNFDQNAPPRYEFRDSVSEYEPATASTKVNCGTNQHDTHGSLPSPASDIGEDNHPSTTDARFDRSAEFDADRNPSNRVSQRNEAVQVPRRSQDIKLSIYAAERRKQLEELERREFAAASSYYDPPSASSVRSKFNFELLPLNLAQQKNKMQRDTGETNETETARVRLKRKQGTSSVDPATSPLEQPAKAFFTSRDLSLNFSSNWQVHGMDLEDTPAPFSMGPFDEASPSRSRRRRNDRRLEAPDIPSSTGIPPARRRLWYGHGRRRLAQARKSRRYPPRSRFIAPDDYVSDRADRIRRFCFYILAVLSILPFFGVLVWSGSFSEALKWATQGEVDRLTYRQRRFIKMMLLGEIIFYTGAVVTIVVYFVIKSKTKN